jgi:hypothetical protein
MVRARLAALLACALLATACSTPAVEGEYRDARDLAYGDCFTRRHLDAEEWATVLVVPCESGSWSFVMLNRFATEYDGPYLDAEFLYEEAGRRCEDGWTTFLMPTEDTWRVGDRIVRCLAEPGFPAGSSV